MIRILTILFFVGLSCGLHAQNVDTTKYTPNAGYGSKFQRLKGTYSVMIPVFGRGGDTTSKVPGELVIIGNNVWFCGTDNHYHLSSTTSTRDTAKLIQGSGIYIANADSTYAPNGFDVIISADTAFLRAYFNNFYSSTTNIVDSASFTFIVDSISNSPPGYAVSGNKYLVGTSPTGAFALHANDIAELVGASYTFTTPSTGDQVWVSNPTQGASAYRFDGTNWILLYVVITQNGNSFGVPVRIGTNDNHELDFIQNGSVAGEFDTGRNFLITKLANLEDSNVLLTLGAGGRIDTVMAHQWVAGNGITFTPGANRTDTISSSGGGGSGHVYAGTGLANVNDSTLRLDTTYTDARYLQDGLIQPGYVTWSGTGLTFDVTGAIYTINGVRYTSGAGSITLAAADVSNPRYDVIAVDNTGTIVKITGTAGTNPTIPQIDPATQVYLTAIYVAANATTPSGITQTLIYDENAEAYSGTSVGVSSNFNNTTSPYHLTKSADIGSWTAGQTVTFTKNTGTALATDYTVLKAYILLKAALSSTANIRVSFLNGTTVVSNVITLNGTYGFTKSNNSSYQNISIPLSAFTFSSTTFNKVRFTLAGTGGGMYLDYVQFQGGIVTTIPIETDPIAINKTITVNGSTQTLNSNPSFTISTGTTTNALTMNNGGAGDASGTTFDGSAARTLSYNTLGAVPTTRTINGTALSSNVTLTLASSQFANQGTTTTVLHGNASGNPSWTAVGLTTDVTGTLPIANGGTNNGSLSVTAGTVYYGDGSKLIGLAPGTSNQILHGGTTPSWKDTTAASGSGSPAGNYGNVQLNRNSAFATPGSDSLSFTSSTLNVNGRIYSPNNDTDYNYRANSFKIQSLSSNASLLTNNMHYNGAWRRDAVGVSSAVAIQDGGVQMGGVVSGAAGNVTPTVFFKADATGVGLGGDMFAAGSGFSGATIYSASNKVGINNLSPTGVLDINGAAGSPFNTSNSNVKTGSLEFQPYSLNNAWIGENVYYNGSNFVYRATGSAGLFYFAGTEGQFRFIASGTAGATATAIGSSAQLKINADGSFATGASTTNAAGVYTSAQLYVKGSNGNVMINSVTDNGSKLQVNGSISLPYVAKTGTYAITASDNTIDCTSGTFTVTLPTAVSITGRQYTIVNSGSGTITIATTSSQTFKNINATPTTLTLAAVGAAAITSYTVRSNGAEWIVTAKVKNE